LKSFIPASAGEVVPIQWDIGSFFAPLDTYEAMIRDYPPQLPIEIERANSFRARTRTVRIDRQKKGNAPRLENSARNDDSRLDFSLLFKEFEGID
jgi:hypothetical protein